MNADVTRELENILGDEEFLLDEPLDRHVSFRAGGPATYFAIPRDENQLISVIKCLRKANEDYFILGNGTNVIAADEGYDGVIIAITSEEFSSIEINEGDTLLAGAGAMLSTISQKAACAGLSGFEQLSGIPGSVGGALRMNAGAYGREIKDIISSAKVYDVFNDNIITVNKDDMELSYRSSVFSRRDLIILSATFSLTKAPVESIRELMRECTVKRVSTQPLDLPSVGSFFKRPNKEGVYAAALIDSSGLKGMQVGGAAVSEKHAGFIVNLGDANTGDILELAQKVVDTVYKDSGYTLEMEPVLIE
jgi:UDP-N-acetylmuramate dehydrogenase